MRIIFMGLYTYPQMSIIYPQINKQPVLFKIHKTFLSQTRLFIHLSTIPTTRTTIKNMIKLV